MPCRMFCGWSRCVYVDVMMSAGGGHVADMFAVVCVCAVVDVCSRLLGSSERSMCFKGVLRARGIVVLWS